MLAAQLIHEDELHPMLDPGPDPALPASLVALPISFSRTIGLFNGASGPLSTSLGVLFLSPWGLEEMCTRRFWREMSEALSDAGIANLRFDYPGSGDALDMDETSGGLGVWEEAAIEAALQMKRLSGCDRLVLVGQGVGALIAARIAGRIDAVEGVAMLAPVVNGRRYLRELSMWSNVVDEGLGLTAQMRDAASVSIAGLVLPDAIAGDLRKINLNDLPAAPARTCLVCERPASEADSAYSAHLSALGATVERAVFSGYDELVSNPAISRTPLTVVGDVVAWVTGIAGPVQNMPPVAGVDDAVLEAAHFSERPVRFGAGGRLFGVLCAPRDGQVRASTLLMGTGYDRHAGWARSTVDMARHLAASGIVSLRFDAANVGDSPPVPGVAPQVLYAPQQVDDCIAALDLMASLGLPPAVLVGRCSGAYLAFHTALADRRCAGVIAVNILSFWWDSRDDVDRMVRHNPRSLGEYRRRAFSIETVRRALTGKADLRRAVMNIAKLARRRILRVVAPVLGGLSADARLHNRVLGAFRNLRDRNVPLSLVFSENDVGLARLAEYFGKRQRRFDAYRNLSLTTIAQADHNVTPLQARLVLQAHVRDTVLAMSDAK